jgi:DNA-binding response OmpR family regulator
VAQILIVEDDSLLVQQLTLHLQQAGHRCHAESHAEAGLATLQDTGANLIIMDVMLPGLSGFELCRRVRSSSDHFTVPILMISAMASQEEISHGLAQGADDFVAKPLNLKVVLDRVEILLQLNGATGQRDGLTELAGGRGIKLEMQRAITRQQTFALVYAELLNLAHFGRSVGEEGRTRTVRHFGRGLHVVGLEVDGDCFRVGHLGGGHFLCLVSPEKARPYAQKVLALWESHLPRLYDQFGRQRMYEDALASRIKNPNQPTPLLEALFCITIRDASSHSTVKEMIETISHLRQGALAAHAQGIYFDRRHGAS